MSTPAVPIKYYDKCMRDRRLWDLSVGLGSELEAPYRGPGIYANGEYSEEWAVWYLDKILFYCGRQREQV